MGYVIPVERMDEPKWISVDARPDPNPRQGSGFVSVTINNNREDESTVLLPTAAAFDFALAVLRAVEQAGGVR